MSKSSFCYSSIVSVLFLDRHMTCLEINSFLNYFVCFECKKRTLFGRDRRRKEDRRRKDGQDLSSGSTSTPASTSSAGGKPGGGGSLGGGGGGGGAGVMDVDLPPEVAMGVALGEGFDVLAIMLFDM